ncbi:hypothetical protein MATL_G00182680 [Megalops atlanticus]|uniref:Uncharacterized protein n=1 Tax=Megalops atlanticus TaxID=7932 RepID=A0A9D3PRT1_MEGAT|nr:hypothetical protein MATL_G00182680 [Megalops atlanticus]
MCLGLRCNLCVFGHVSAMRFLLFRNVDVMELVHEAFTKGEKLGFTGLCKRANYYRDDMKRTKNEPSGTDRGWYIGFRSACVQPTFPWYLTTAALHVSAMRPLEAWRPQRPALRFHHINLAPERSTCS